MYKIKRRLFISLSLLLTFLTSSSLAVYADTYYKTDEYEYKYLTEDTIMLSDYFGESNTLTIPDTFLDRKVVSVEPNAFYQNTNIEYINFGKNFNTISAMSFSGSGLKELNLPKSMKSIVWGAFSECKELVSVTIDNSELTTIPRSCFYDCTKLEKVELSKNITTIAKAAFADCTSLEFIEIHRATTTISPDAFINCPNLTIYGYEGSYAQQYATENNIPFVAFPEYENGDVNLDGTLSVDDVTFLQMHIARYDNFVSDDSYKVADFDGNGTIDINDVTMIQLYLAGYVV